MRNLVVPAGNRHAATSSPDEHWGAQALCADEDPEDFAIPGKNLRPENRRALKVCGSCPVQAQCRRDIPGGSATIVGGVAYSASGKVLATAPGVTA